MLVKKAQMKLNISFKLAFSHSFFGKKRVAQKGFFFQGHPTCFISKVVIIGREGGLNSKSISMQVFIYLVL